MVWFYGFHDAQLRNQGDLRENTAFKFCIRCVSTLFWLLELFMTVAKKLVTTSIILASALALLVGFSIYQESYNNDCGLSESQANGMVIKDLKLRKLPISGLSKPKLSGSCRVEYTYSESGVRLDYAVITSWGYGVKLTVYDYNQ
jgi:hypothetical protein